MSRRKDRSYYANPHPRSHLNSNHVTKKKPECLSGKRIFASERDCLISIINQYHNGEITEPPEQPLMPYRCPMCDNWHKTSHIGKSRKKTQSKKVKIKRSNNPAVFNITCPICVSAWSVKGFDKAVNEATTHFREKHK